ncbi:reverse transcriptase domain-containing protein [Tanacetum coccineum]
MKDVLWSGKRGEAKQQIGTKQYRKKLKNVLMPDVQKLNRKLASLNRFLAKSAEKSLPFFKTLKKCTKKSDFHWTEEAEAAFKQMKQLIAELPTYRDRKERRNHCFMASYKRRPDFIVERPEEDDPNTAMDVEEELLEPFEATYNEAEYEALIAGLRITEEMGIKNLQANVDSRLVANQVNGTYIAKEADMIRYLEKVRTLTKGFKMFSIKQVPRIEEEGNAWMTPIYEYLIEETLSAEVNKARAVRRTRSVVAKALRMGYYWFTTHNGCRGIDLGMSRLPGSPDLSQHFNYFTKWIEAKPVATITGNQVKKFVWDNIVCRFGLLGEIISDNGKQFRDNPYKDWCEKLCIRQRFASVKHLQVNG